MLHHSGISGAAGPYALRLQREAKERRARMSSATPVAKTKRPERPPATTMPIVTPLIYPAYVGADDCDREPSPSPEAIDAAVACPSRVREIQNLICTNLRVRREEMLSQRRTRLSVMARQVAMYLCKRHTPLSYPDIGRRFNGRDHTTVLHGYRHVTSIMAGAPGTATSAQWLAKDSDFVREVVNTAESTIATWSNNRTARASHPARSGGVDGPL